MYKTPEGTKCACCGELCQVIALDNSFDYAGTHCTGGVGGVHYPEGWGDPVSDCCEDDCLDIFDNVLDRHDVYDEPDYGY